jgi:hypothetical protein
MSDSKNPGPLDRLMDKVAPIAIALATKFGGEKGAEMEKHIIQDFHEGHSLQQAKDTLKLDGIELMHLTGLESLTSPAQTPAGNKPPQVKSK